MDEIVYGLLVIAWILCVCYLIFWRKDHFDEHAEKWREYRQKDEENEQV